MNPIRGTKGKQCILMNVRGTFLKHSHRTLEYMTDRFTSQTRGPENKRKPYLSLTHYTVTSQPSSTCLPPRPLPPLPPPLPERHYNVNSQPSSTLTEPFPPAYLHLLFHLHQSVKGQRAIIKPTQTRPQGHHNAMNQLPPLCC